MSQAVQAMFKHKIELLEEILNDISDCAYTTRAQVMGHLHNELEFIKGNSYAYDAKLDKESDNE